MAELGQLSQFEDEHRGLKQLVAGLTLDTQLLPGTLRTIW
jgi:hypothetical protein